MSFSNFIKSFFPIERFRQTLKRFPLPALCAAGAFVAALLHIYEVIKEDDLFARLLAVAGCAYFWTGIVKLYAESRALKPVYYYAASVVPLILLAAFIFMSPNYYLNLQFFVPALLLMITVAPFTRGGDDASVWSFNYQTWFGVGMSIFAGLILGGGISLALVSVHYLFDIRVEDKAYGTAWSFAALLLTPVYALSWVPERFIFSKEECRAPVQLGFIINWLLAPLVWLYLLILYAYLVKILLTMEVPRGQLAYMISGFGAVGVITYLVGWPMREEGAPLLRGFYKYFFPLLIIPVGMMVYAVGERIAAYGITEQRYMLIVAVLWFAALCILFLLHRFPLKIITASLAALFLLASFGPWGGVSVSGWSQFSRLKMLLAKYEILKGGEIEKTSQEVPFKDAQNITSIIDYLNWTERDNVLRPWFEEPGKDWAFPGTTEILARMGLKYVGAYEREPNEEYFNFMPSKGSPFITLADAGGYDYLFPNRGVYGESMVPLADITEPPLSVKASNNLLEITLKDRPPLRIDLQKFAAEMAEKYKYGPPEGSIALMEENEALRAKLDAYSMQGEFKDEKIINLHMNFNLFVDVKAP